MKKLLCALVIASSLFLTGCFSPPPVPPVDPFPYSFTDPTRALYPRTVAGAHRFIADVRVPRWTPVSDVAMQRVQDPFTSFRKLAGDCDDYAVMNGKFLQEYFGHDTFLVFMWIFLEGRPQGHVVAFTPFPVHQCPRSPRLEYRGVVYHSMEWCYRSWWRWSTDGVLDTEGEAGIWDIDWTDESHPGRHIRVEGRIFEWHQIIDLIMDVDGNPLGGRCAELTLINP